MNKLGGVFAVCLVTIFLAGCQSTTVYEIDGKRYTDVDDVIAVQKRKSAETIALTEPVPEPLGGRVKVAYYSQEGYLAHRERLSERDGFTFDREDQEKMRYYNALNEIFSGQFKSILERSQMFDSVELDLREDPKAADIGDHDYLIAYEGMQGIIIKWRVDRANPPATRTFEIEAQPVRKDNAGQNRKDRVNYWVNQVYRSINDMN